MPNEKTGNEGFLAVIDAKIAALQALRETYVKAAALGILGQPGAEGDFAALLSNGQNQRTVEPFDLPNGAFLNKSLPDAIKLFLSATKRKQAPKDVAVALKEGGFESTSKNFEGTVNGTMHRMRDQGVLLKFKDGFGLADLYPEHLRAKIGNGKESKPKAKAGKATTTKKSAKARAASKPGSGPKGPSLDERVLGLLKSKDTEWFTQQQVGEALRETAQMVALAFARLVRYGKVAKRDDGRYAAPRAA